MREEKRSEIIGKTSATELQPNTSEKFFFWLKPGIIANPFDIVEAEHVSRAGTSPSYTYGLITNIEHRTDAPSHLSNFISSNFGDVSEIPNTPRQGTSIAHVNVLSNDADIYMPLSAERPVRFADKKGIEKALGIEALMKERPNNAIPAGLIKLSNGTSAIAYLDRRYILGPEAAHINIGGISGLATKTSYAMFLIQSILQKTPEKERDKIAVVILNVKQGDLLKIEESPENPLSSEQMELWEALGLEAKPFEAERVHYFLPRGERGTPNSHLIPNIYQIYAYDFRNTADKLDLLFTHVPDIYSTLESIIGEIKEGVRNNEPDFKNIDSWENLLIQPPLFDPETKSPVKNWRGIHGSSIGVFKRHMRRIVVTQNTGIFVNSLSTSEKILSEEIRKIKGGHIYVIDIAKLRDEEQTLVFGDLLRTIYDIKSRGAEDEEGNIIEPPEKVIFFVDELNKYAPSGGKVSSIAEQVLDIASRGRSLGVILFSAEQFMSQVHHQVIGNCGTKIIGRTSSSEISASEYRFLDDELKLSVTRLNKGELLLNHAIYRQPVKIIFPKPAFWQPSK